MMTMTRQEAFKKIQKFAKAYGVRLEDRTVSWAGQANDPEDKQYLDIRVFIEAKTWEKTKATYTLEAYASVCRMGGNPSAYELQAAADEIDRGASFVAALNNLNIEIVEVKEEEIA